MSTLTGADQSPALFLGRTGMKQAAPIPYDFLNQADHSEGHDAPCPP